MALNNPRRLINHLTKKPKQIFAKVSFKNQDTKSPIKSFVKKLNTLRFLYNHLPHGRHLAREIIEFEI